MALTDLTHIRPARTQRTLFSFAMDMVALHRQRTALRRLDDSALADLGLTRSEAMNEANRAPWDVPTTWLR